MDKKTGKEKNIVREIKDKATVVLYPTKGVEVYTGISAKKFYLGENITNYKVWKYEFHPKLISSTGVSLDYDSYLLEDFLISLWVDDEVVHTIACDDTCLWQEKELIGMLYDDFVKVFDIAPDDIDKQWSPGPYINGRNYDVYIFDSLGLMLWVWHKRIRQILISIPSEESEE